MCTRVALTRNHDAIRQSLLEDNGLQIDEWHDSNEFQPHENIGDMMTVPVVVYRPSHRKSSKEAIPAANIMRSSRWRLVPHYYKVEDESKKTLEASAEDMINNQGFGKVARTQRRCAVVCQGYFSFPKSQQKLPTYLKREDNRLLLLAGICASATIDGKELHSFAVVTTKGEPRTRRPVILGNAIDVRQWLEQRYWTEPLEGIATAPHNDAINPLERYEVPNEVRKLGVQSPTFILPVKKRADGIGQALKAVEERNKRPREAIDADDEDLGRRTPPPGGVPPTPESSSPRKLRITGPIPSPCKVRITPSKPLRVTQVNARESPTPPATGVGSSSLGSRSRDHDSDAEMNDAEYVAGSSEEEDGSGVANAEAGPSTRKGKEREIPQRRGRRKVGQSKYFA